MFEDTHTRLVPSNTTLEKIAIDPAFERDFRIQGTPATPMPTATKDDYTIQDFYRNHLQPWADLYGELPADVRDGLENLAIDGGLFLGGTALAPYTGGSSFLPLIPKLMRYGSYLRPAYRGVKDIYQGVGDAAKELRENADPRFVPLLQTGALAGLAAGAGTAAAAHSIENNPDMQKAIGYQGIKPFLPTPLRLAHSLSGYNDQLVHLNHNLLDVPSLLLYGAYKQGKGQMTQGEFQVLWDQLQKSKEYRQEHADIRQLPKDIYKVYDTTTKGIQALNSVTNNKNYGERAAGFLTRNGLKTFLPWPWKGLTYLPAEDAPNWINPLDEDFQNANTPLHEAAIEMTKKKGLENYYNKEVLPLFEMYKNAPVSEKPQILNKIVNQVGSRFNLPANELQAQILEKGIDSVAENLKNSVANKSRLNQYVPGYDATTDVRGKAQTAGNIAATGQTLANVAAAPMRGLSAYQKVVDSVANEYSRDDLLGIIAKQNPDQWKYESFQKAFESMSDEDLMRAARVIPPKPSENIENDLRANPDMRVKNEVGVPLFIDRDAVNYTLRQGQGIEDVANKVDRMDQQTKKLQQARGKFVDTTQQAQDFVNHKLEPVQDKVDNVVQNKVNTNINTAAEKAKALLRNKLQPQNTSPTTVPQNTQPAPKVIKKPRPVSVPSVPKIPVPTTATTNNPVNIPKVPLPRPKPVPQPQPTQVPQPTTVQTAQKTGSLLTYNYKIGALKAVKEFSKVSGYSSRDLIKLLVQY